MVIKSFLIVSFRLPNSSLMFMYLMNRMFRKHHDMVVIVFIDKDEHTHQLRIVLQVLNDEKSWLSLANVSSGCDLWLFLVTLFLIRVLRSILRR